MKHQVLGVIVALTGAVFATGNALRAADTVPASDQATTLAGAPPAIPSDDSSEFSLGSGSPWRFVPQATAMVTYDDNIFITPTNKVSDTYFQFAPGFALGLGDFRGQVTPYAPIPHLLAQTGEEDLPRTNFVYVDYTPDFEVFVKNHRENTVNQDVRLAGQEQSDLWRIYGAFHYELVTEPNIYLGDRARQTYYDANFDGSYALTGKLNSGLQVYANRSEITGGYTQQTGKVTGYLDYVQSEKTEVGLGIAAGDLEQTDDPNQPYLQALLRFRYHATAKISLTGDAGVESLHQGYTKGHTTSGVFDINADYAATESTTFTLSTRRSTVGAVEYQGVDVWESVYQAGIRQRVGNGFAVTATGGLVWDQYAPFSPTVALHRRDEYSFYKLAVGHDLTKHGTAQIAFEHRDDDSSVPNFRFTENLLTLNLSFLF